MWALRGGGGTWDSEPASWAPDEDGCHSHVPPGLAFSTNSWCLKARRGPVPDANSTLCHFPEVGRWLGAGCGGSGVPVADWVDRAGSPFPKATVEKGSGAKAATKGVRGTGDIAATLSAATGRGRQAGCTFSVSEAPACGLRRAVVPYA